MTLCLTGPVFTLSVRHGLKPSQALIVCEEVFKCNFCYGNPYLLQKRDEFFGESLHQMALIETKCVS